MSDPSGKRMWVCEDEFYALNGLPAMQFQLYMKLRWYMDAKTGRVGLVRGISYQSLAEELFVEPIPGRRKADAGSPSVQAVRSALHGLERAGLIRPCGNGEVLVFLLPKAQRISARQKEQQQGNNRGEQQWSNTPQTRMDADGSTGYPQQQQQGLPPEQQHTSRLKENPPTVIASAASERVVAREPVAQPDVLLRLDASEMAEWVRSAEASRGKIAGKVVSRAAELVLWQSRGLTMGELQEAYSMAVSDREVRQNPHPLNPGFLNVFVKRVLEGRRVSREGRSVPARQVLSQAGAQWQKEAEKLGVERQRADEDADGFIARVMRARQATAGKGVGGAGR